MTLIDRTERQTSEDVVVQGGGWIIKGLFGWALVLSAVGVWGPFAPASDTFTLVIKLAAPLPVIRFRNGLRRKSDQSKKRLGIVFKDPRIMRKPEHHVPPGCTAGERIRYCAEVFIACRFF